MRKENIVSRAAAAATALVLLGGVVFTSCQQPTTTEPETAKHTVTFDSKGGTEIAPVTVEDGKTVAKPETDPAKNGYDFGGWQNGEAEYDFSAAVTSNLTLTAKWTAHAYTITYELNGGTNSADNPETYTIESEDITLKDPTGPAAAPVFQGWYSDKDFQNRVSPAVIAKGSTGDRTFYARFGTEALKEFTVTFNVVAEAGGAVLGSDSVKVNDGDKISDAQLEAAKGKIASLGEYEYDGLYTDAALATAFDTSAKISADTTLYVKVKAVQKFTVTFDSDGGSAVAAVTVKSGEKAAKPADPAKDGYTFKGWDFDFSTPIKADTEVKAKWVEANYENVPLTGGWGYTFPATSGEIKFSNQYGEFYIGTEKGVISTESYTGIKIVVAEANSNVQIKMTKADGKTGTEKKGGYIQLSATETTVTFSDYTDEKSVYAAIQNSVEDEQVINIKGVYLISADGETPVAITKNWGADIAAYSGVVTFTDQYGQIAQVKGKSVSQYTGAVIELEEVPENIQFKVVYDDDSEKYIPIDSVSKTYEFDTSKNSVKDFSIQAAAANSVVKIKSLKLIKK